MWYIAAVFSRWSQTTLQLLFIDYLWVTAYRLTIPYLKCLRPEVFEIWAAFSFFQILEYFHRFYWLSLANFEIWNATKSKTFWMLCWSSKRFRFRIFGLGMRILFPLHYFPLPCYDSFLPHLFITKKCRFCLQNIL